MFFHDETLEPLLPVKYMLLLLPCLSLVTLASPIYRRPPPPLFYPFFALDKSFPRTLTYIEGSSFLTPH